MERRGAVGYLLVAVAATTWGCWSLILRPAGLPATVTCPALFLVMGLAASALGRLDGMQPHWGRRTVLLLLAHAVLDVVNVLGYFGAMRVTTVAIAVLSHYLAPLLVALAAPFVTGRRVRGAPLAAAVGVAGLTLVLEPWHAAGENAWLGAGLGAVSALGYAGGVFVGRELAQRIGPLRTIGWHSLIAAGLMLPFVDWSAARQASSLAAGLLVLGAIGPGLIAGRMFLAGMLVIGPTRAAMLAFLEPLVAVTIGWLAWSEPLGPMAVLGGALVVAGGAWVTLAREDARIPGELG